VTVNVVPKEASYLDFVWTSADTTVATVVKGIVTGIAEGSTTVTVSGGTVSSSEVQAKIPVTVRPLTNEPLTSFEVWALSVSLMPDGDPVQLRVTKEPEMSIATVTYATLAEGIVTVSETGLITPVALGIDTVTVSYEGLTSVKIPVEVVKQVFPVVGRDKKDESAKNSTIIEVSKDGVTSVTVLETENSDPQFYCSALVGPPLEGTDGKLIFECITNRAIDGAEVFWFKSFDGEENSGLCMKDEAPITALFPVPLCEDWTTIEVDIPEGVIADDFGRVPERRDYIRIDPTPPGNVGYQIKYRNIRIVMYE
jgi:hypothetical protein